MSKEISIPIILSAQRQQSSAPRAYEIIIIDAGKGNGWEFSPGVLQQGANVFNQVECFVDHTRGGRSVRDICGIITQARFDPQTNAIRAILTPAGPAADILHQAAAAMLGDGPHPNIGFSADIIIEPNGKTVKAIVSAKSVDLVYNPARGGRFVRSLNQQQENPKMTDEHKPPAGDDNSPANETLLDQVQSDAAAMRALLQVQEERQRIADEAEKARQTRIQMGEYLLDAALGASKLHPAMQTHVREQFSGRVFSPDELQTAIEEARRITAELTAGASIYGGPRLDGMTTTEEQLQAAVDDLLGAPRDQAMHGKTVHALTGIRELYTMLTGDTDMHGTYHAERVRLATTATMPNLVKNAMNKVIADQWEKLGRAGYTWWERIVQVEHFTSLQQITGILVSEIGLLPAVSEGDPYTELPIDDSGETADWNKYGGYLPITLELLDRDDTRKLRQYPRKLANAALRRISHNVADVFTANSGAGPAMSDGNNLFSAAHNNLLTAALSSTAWETASQAIYDQNMLVASGQTAPKLALEARYLVVPRALKLTARQILEPYWDPTANVHSENLQRGADDAVVVCPDFTDANDWAALADPRLAPAIILGERFGLRPEIYIAGDELSPAMFTNDESRIKVRHFLAVAVVDYRPVVKSNVA